jgi:hypothetical protein
VTGVQELNFTVTDERAVCCNCVLYEKLLVAPLHSMEPEGLLQQPATDPYPEPDQSTPYHTTPSYLPKIHFNIIISSMSISLSLVSTTEELLDRKVAAPV